MKLRKILATVAASAMALSTMAVAASANEAFLMYAAGGWAVSSMDGTTANAVTADVTTDGTYTVAVQGFEYEDEDTAEMVPATATGAEVFCVDIVDLAADFGFGKGSEAYDALGSDATEADKMAVAKDAGIEISNVVVTLTSADGTTTDVPVDMSKIYYGDIEGNGKLRIEIFNAYGDTSKDAPIDTSAITFDDAMSVTFTIAGLGGASSDAAGDDASNGAVVDTDNTTDTGKDAVDTGVEGVAAVAGLAVVAAGAVVLSKKRK